MVVMGKEIVAKRLYDETVEVYEIYVNNHLSGYAVRGEMGFYQFLHDIEREFFNNIRELSAQMAGLQLFDEWELEQELGTTTWQVIVDEVSVGYVFAEVGEDGLYRHYYATSLPATPPVWYNTQLAAVYHLLESLGYNISVAPGVSL